MATIPTLALRPPAWSALERALIERKPILVGYHGHQRLLCPHALGWKNGRSKLLAYQAAGTSSQGELSADPQRRWRSMFVDEMDGPLVPGDGPWQSADNYGGYTNCFDQIEVAVRA